MASDILNTKLGQHWFRQWLVAWGHQAKTWTNADLSSMRSSNNHINSLWPSDAMWRQRTVSTLAQVMACFLTAPSHYLNQCWRIMNLVLWHHTENNFIGISQNINLKNEFENYNFKIITASPRGLSIKSNSIYPSHQSLKLTWRLLI